MDQTIIGEKATVVFTGNLFDATNYTQATITITDKSVKIANTDGFNLADGATLKVTSPDGYTLDTSVVGTAPFTSAGTYTEADILAKDGDTVKYTGKGSDYDGFVADSGSLTYHSARTDSFTFAADNGTGIAFLDNLNLTGTDLTGAITIGEADNGVKTVTINDTSKLFKAVDNQTADTTATNLHSVLTSRQLLMTLPRSAMEPTLIKARQLQVIPLTATALLSLTRRLIALS